MTDQPNQPAAPRLPPYLSGYPGPWCEKAWGRCRLLFVDNQIEIVEAEIVAGGYSSVHKHLWKDNTFQVVSGELEVLLYPSSLRPTIHRLLPSCNPLDCGTATIPPHVPHKFVALQATRLIEIYRAKYGHSIDCDDICRMSAGGVRNVAP